MNILHKVLGFLEYHYHLVNDFRELDRQSVLQKIVSYSQFSLSYLLMLISSTVVCTLGLILNSLPVVIGGMIISPLMWPLMKVSIGITYERRSILIQAIKLIVISIVFSILSAYLITYISPVKQLGDEILARTNPTILDVLVAISAGSIAALSLVHKKTSDSVAGVAIATSLMPPLCVSGIGLALSNYSVASSAFILFFSNVISIIFITVFIYNFIGIKREADSVLRRNGIIVVSIMLILVSVPLAFLLRDYSFKARIYEDSKSAIQQSLSKVSNQIYIQNVKTSIKGTSDGSVIYLEVDALVPEDIIIDYKEQSEIIKSLEESLNSRVDLSLKLQRSISIISEEQEKTNLEKSKLTEIAKEEISRIDSSIRISSLDIKQEGDEWTVTSVVRVNPAISVTYELRDSIKDAIEKKSGKTINLDLTLVPILNFKSDEENDFFGNLTKDVSEKITAAATSGIVQSVVVRENVLDPANGVVYHEPSISCDISILIPANYEIDNEEFSEIKKELEEKYSRTFILNITYIRAEIVNL